MNRHIVSRHVERRRETISAAHAGGLAAARQSPGYTPISTDNFRDLRDQQQSFENVAAFAFAGVRLAAANSESQELFSAAVTGDYFNVLGVPAALGRTIQRDDDGGTRRTPGFSGIAADGSPLPAHEGYWTGVMRRTPQGWKIVHSHSSDPH